MSRSEAPTFLAPPSGTCRGAGLINMRMSAFSGNLFYLDLLVCSTFVALWRKAAVDDMLPEPLRDLLPW